MHANGNARKLTRVSIRNIIFLTAKLGLQIEKNQRRHKDETIHTNSDIKKCDDGRYFNLNLFMAFGCIAQGIPLTSFYF